MLNTGRAFAHRMATLLLAAAPAAILAGPALAQGSDASVVETVTVTGTQIRGAAPVGSPIIAMDRSQMELTGAITTTDFLRTVPQVFNYGITDTQRTGIGGAGNISYASAINIRGLSPFATLTLVDGHRTVGSGTLAQAVDPSDVPTVMLQRVDIVADGASATYGSDAIAGVANLILRRNFDGEQVSGHVGFGRGYNEQQVDVLVGRQWDTGQVTIGLEHSLHNPLRGTSRDFYTAYQVPMGGNDYRVTNCNPGTIVTGGKTYAIPAGGVTPATANLLVAGTSNLCDPLKYTDLIPGQSHDGGAATFDQRVTSWLKIFGDAFYTRRNFSRNVSQTAGGLTVTSANPNFVAPPGTTVKSEVVNYFFGGQGIGNSIETTGYSVNTQFTLGADVNLWGDWLWETTGSTSYNHDESFAPSITGTSTMVTTALNGTNPNGALNLFGGANSTALLQNLASTLTVSSGQTHQSNVISKVDGTLLTLPGGAVRGAFGAAYDHINIINGQIVSLTTARTGGFRPHASRDDYALYGELLVPLVGEGNAMPWMQKLDLDVGVRYTDYTVVGATTNEKLGLTWKVNDDVSIHSSYGTSFRAPLLSELVGPTNFVYVQNYSTPTGPQQGLTLAGGNINLKPETAITWSIGGDWTPAAVKGLKLGLNYYHINWKNGISSYLSNLNLLLNPAKYAALITPCPSTACTNLINKYVLGVGPNPDPRTVRGVLPANPVAFVDGTQQNLATTLTSGVDLQASYDMPTANAGDFGFGIVGSYVAEFNQAVTPGAPVGNELNRIGFPLRMRFRAYTTWQMDAWSAAMFINYTTGYQNDTATPVQNVDPYTTVDAHLGYDLTGKFGMDFLNQARISVDATNLFDTNPPYVNTIPTPNGGGGYDPQAASPLGRLISVSVEKKF